MLKIKKMLNQLLWLNFFAYFNFLFFIVVLILFFISIYFFSSSMKDLIVDYLPDLTHTLSIWKSIFVMLGIVFFCVLVNYSQFI